MIVTNVGWDAVDAAASGARRRAGRKRLLRTAKPCGPDAPTLAFKFAMMLRITRTMVANKPGHQGERGVSRKLSRRESRIDPVEPVVLPRAFFARTHGCDRHPAFPAPSHEGSTVPSVFCGRTTFITRAHCAAGPRSRIES
jgi:hypothetical protein